MAGNETDCGCKHEVDIYRDTPVRLLGYANEVGESFRALVNVWAVRFSYLVAFSYVVADTVDKTSKAHKRKCADEAVHDDHAKVIAFDTLLWQTLASVAIPGFTINRICAFSLFILGKSSKISPIVCKWSSTAIGLFSIPFIVHPIDNSVEAFMNYSVRPLYIEYLDKKPSD